MNKKLPNLYKNNNIKNNTNKVESKVDERCLDTKLDYNTVKSKIDKLFKSIKYVFNIGVIIKTKNEVLDTKIIGRVKNSIITEDLKEIPIIDIEDIIIK